MFENFIINKGKCMKERKRLSNNKQIELLRTKINEIELRRINETNIADKRNLTLEEITLRKEYTVLLKKKRPLLLTLAIALCFIYAISLEIFLPPYFIRGAKIKINNDKIAKLEVEFDILSKQLQ